MKLFAISDLHLTKSADKPMDIFGESWIGHWDKICADWRKKVSEDDVVLIAGDISWGMKLSEATEDLSAVDALPGKKVIIRGNHDYWWASPAKINALGYDSITFLQNNAARFGSYVICGTRGWTIPENGAEPTAEDKKILAREALRLELSLQAAAQFGSDTEIIGMTHYPVFPFSCEKTVFTELFARYGVKRVVYGHLHGKQARAARPVTEISGVRYILTSCDFLKNTLLEL